VLCEELLPYLIVKKDKATELIAYGKGEVGFGDRVIRNNTEATVRL
jgi:hypothetical protein